MRNREVNSRLDLEFEIVCIALLSVAITFAGCAPDPPPSKAPNKLPPPIAFSSADYADGYEGHTVLVDSFAIESKPEAYYLAGQLRAAQTRSFVIERPNQQLYVCVGNNKTKRQAERIRDYLNSRYELGAVVLEPEIKQQPEE
jgi:hypothetical protein